MKRRPRTLVLARRRRQLPAWLGWLVLATALTLATMTAARAQTAPPAPLPPKSGATGPTTLPPAGAPARSGVISPPATVDPGMTRGTPDSTAFPTPVLRPPGPPNAPPK